MPQQQGNSREVASALEMARSKLQMGRRLVMEELCWWQARIWSAWMCKERNGGCSEENRVLLWAGQLGSNSTAAAAAACRGSDFSVTAVAAAHNSRE